MAKYISLVVFGNSGGVLQNAFRAIVPRLPQNKGWAESQADILPTFSS